MSDDLNVFCEELDSCTGLRISIALLRNVENSKDVKAKVMSGSLQCAVIKASLIVDPCQVVVAANRAAIGLSTGTMVTRSVYTELLFNLSISKNISQSLIKFGVHEDDQDILVATFDKQDASSIDSVLSEIVGRLVPLSELRNICDRKLVCKSYKVGDLEAKTTTLLDSVVSRIATSEFVSH
ncbi:hypothetical protein ONE63_008302 [Megalurothrips usitatus]|uniref:EKC/KEOPS complex subunit TPRKB-like n=1 Tax=Megalurothrips usitatus TaxID=439358 RepID=A0AAV7XLQ1_9NEOP|nr:hypothetical protein ONE63_008302 [Megalurothrips usitatus]